MMHKRIPRVFVKRQHLMVSILSSHHDAKIESAIGIAAGFDGFGL